MRLRAPKKRVSHTRDGGDGGVVDRHGQHPAQRNHNVLAVDQDVDQRFEMRGERPAMVRVRCRAQLADQSRCPLRALALCGLADHPVDVAVGPSEVDDHPTNGALRREDQMPDHIAYAPAGAETRVLPLGGCELVEQRGEPEPLPMYGEPYVEPTHRWTGHRLLCAHPRPPYTFPRLVTNPSR